MMIDGLALDRTQETLPRADSALCDELKRGKWKIVPE
jgi:hypothetical protein